MIKSRSARSNIILVAELIPCLNCGATVELEHWDRDGIEGWVISCTGCGNLFLPVGRSEKEAIRYWNWLKR